MMEMSSIEWRHDVHDSVSNHRSLDCLFNRLFRRKSNKTPKLCNTGPLWGEFPAQKVRNAEKGSIRWRHHDDLDANGGRINAYILYPTLQSVLDPGWQGIGCSICAKQQRNQYPICGISSCNFRDCAFHLAICIADNLKSQKSKLLSRKCNQIT